MKDTSIQKVTRKRDWGLTQSALSGLLTWLDEGTDSKGEKYLEVRSRLVSYFDRKNCRMPEDLADETLNRVARRLEEEGEITDASPAHYCYIVAKFVFLEYLRRVERGDVSLDDLTDSGLQPAVTAFTAPGEEDREREEVRLDCLDRCLEKLDSTSRGLITDYYRGGQRVKIENRRSLAERFGITANALSIRACRIRDRLESCVGDCMNRFG